MVQMKPFCGKAEVNVQGNRFFISGRKDRKGFGYFGKSCPQSFKPFRYQADLPQFAFRRFPT